MVNENKENHEKTNQEGAFSGISPDLVSEFRSDGKFSCPGFLSERKFPFDLFEVEIVVEVDFLFDFFLHVY